MDNITIENLHLENKGNLFAIIKAQREEIAELKDKLSRRNMQIRELKQKIARAIYERTCPRDEQNRMRCKECFLNKDCIIVR